MRKIRSSALSAAILPAPGKRCGNSVIVVPFLDMEPRVIPERVALAFRIRQSLLWLRFRRHINHRARLQMCPSGFVASHGFRLTLGAVHEVALRLDRPE